MTNNEFFNDFFGETISVYTDADAQDDGILIDVSDLQVFFNGKIINRCTFGADEILNLFGRGKESAAADLLFISLNSKKDREGFDAWGIFEPHKDFGNVKFWLVGNEVEGYTIMLPSEY